MHLFSLYVNLYLLLTAVDVAAKISTEECVDVPSVLTASLQLMVLIVFYGEILVLPARARLHVRAAIFVVTPTLSLLRPARRSLPLPSQTGCSLAEWCSRTLSARTWPITRR